MTASCPRHLLLALALAGVAATPASHTPSCNAATSSNCPASTPATRSGLTAGTVMLQRASRSTTAAYESASDEEDDDTAESKDASSSSNREPNDAGNPSPSLSKDDGRQAGSVSNVSLNLSPRELTWTGRITKGLPDWSDSVKPARWRYGSGLVWVEWALFRDHVVPMICLGLILTAVGAFVVSKVNVEQPSRHQKPMEPPKTALRRRVERLPVSTSEDVRTMLADSNLIQACEASNLIRIHGRVVTKPTLVGPLSGSQCVAYSASASHRRHDGIHQPPIAFHSAGADFAVEFFDAPHIHVAVRSRDVALFDIVEGYSGCEATFGEAPDPWRSFVLEHLLPGADTQYVSLGTSDSIDFRESVLAAGSIVTCIGMVTQDADGGLRLCPWQPSLVADPTPSAAKWLPSWGQSGSGADVDDGALVGRVMISDDLRLHQQ